MKPIRFFQLSAVLLISNLIISCGSTETIRTHQAETGTEIDGNLSGWPVSEARVSDSDLFSYYTMQDAEHLYLFVDFKSPFFHSAVQNSGFILYLNPIESSRNRIGIGYPVGAFNFLRSSPNTYRDFTRDPEWLASTQNQDRMEALREQNFDEVMIVERFDSGTDYGFMNHFQLEGQGIEIAVDVDSRYYRIEYKIPLDGSHPFELEAGREYWLGFAIEPPSFNFPSQNTSQQGSRRQNQQRLGSTHNQQMQLRRQLGQHEEWFKIMIQ